VVTVAAKLMMHSIHSVREMVDLMVEHYFILRTAWGSVLASSSDLALEEVLRVEHAIKAKFHVFSRFLTVREPSKQVFHKGPAYVKATKLPVVRWVTSTPKVQATIAKEHSIATKPKLIATTDFTEHCSVKVVPVEVPAWTPHVPPL